MRPTKRNLSRGFEPPQSEDFQHILIETHAGPFHRARPVDAAVRSHHKTGHDRTSVFTLAGNLSVFGCDLEQYLRLDDGLGRWFILRSRRQFEFDAVRRQILLGSLQDFADRSRDRVRWFVGRESVDLQ